ncbi:type II secretion system protein GspL [Motilimonas eburnea]|uniref:type II secretion system protein GspL n=1 Tax=Motilimonas eburnea TaxID=1737488 RepID=UPI001E465FED|nr:type II secretion system protein GspL [Motilimonas eburnea]
MSERLVVRLGSEANHVIDWLVWSSSEQEIIASGQLNHAEQLSQLHEKAGGRPIITLLPASDVLLTQVEVPGKLTKQLQQALPYMIEEELATDVDNLHFSVLNCSQGVAHLAVVEKSKMDTWLDWLEAAQLKCRQVLPDVLALPANDAAWSAMQMGDDWLIKQGEYSGFSCDQSLLPFLLERWLTATDSEDEPKPKASASEEASDETATEAGPQVIYSYTPLPQDVPGDWQLQPPELPMQLMAQGALTSSLNLLTGEYQPQKEYSKNWLLWKKVGIAAAACLVLGVLSTVLSLQQLKQENEQLKQQIKQVYVSLFPNEQNIRDARIKAQLKRHLAKLENQTQGADLLGMLAKIQPAFKQIPSFKPVSLKYEAKNAELRLQIKADTYADFEKFQSLLDASLEVKQGAMSNQGNKVTGTLTIRGQG